jgi:glycosyltransferase involved in cell wall biosynthesis
VSVTLAIVTYKRAWALPHSLGSIASQVRLPDQVLIVLKPSNDGSEGIISKYASKLPIKTLIQYGGNVTTAVQIAIDNADGDLLVFIDDDAVAEPLLIQKYIDLFTKLPNAGGIGGDVYNAYLSNGLVMTNERFTNTPSKRVIHREPLPEYTDYVEWVSRSGFMGSREAPSNGTFKSVFLMGANMAWRIEAVHDCPLTQLYRKSKKGFHYEALLAYCAKKRGFDTYRVVGEESPRVWHIVNTTSLTRGEGFWHEFWVHYDRVTDYMRYKMLGANVSLPLYLMACLATLRSKPLPRLLAMLYAWFSW